MSNVVIVGNISAHLWWFFLPVKRLRIHDNVGVDFTRGSRNQRLTRGCRKGRSFSGLTKVMHDLR